MGGFSKSHPRLRQDRQATGPCSEGLFSAEQLFEKCFLREGRPQERQATGRSAHLTAHPTVGWLRVQPSSRSASWQHKISASCPSFCRVASFRASFAEQIPTGRPLLGHPMDCAPCRAASARSGFAFVDFKAIGCDSAPFL